LVDINAGQQLHETLYAACFFSKIEQRTSDARHRTTCAVILLLLSCASVNACFVL